MARNLKVMNLSPAASRYYARFISPLIDDNLGNTSYTHIYLNIGTCSTLAWGLQRIHVATRSQLLDDRIE